MLLCCSDRSCSGAPWEIIAYLGLYWPFEHSADYFGEECIVSDFRVVQYVCDNVTFGCSKDMAVQKQCNSSIMYYIVTTAKNPLLNKSYMQYYNFNSST